MLKNLVVSQLGGLVSAASKLNTLAAEQGRDNVFLFRAGVPEFNPRYQLSPAPRFVFNFRRGLHISEVYIIDLKEKDEFTLRP